MNTAEWIIVAILSLTLFVFLTLSIILITKLFDLTYEAKHLVKDLRKIAKGGQKIVDKAGDTVDTAASDVTKTTSAVKDAVVHAVKKKLDTDK
ncbi:hypothetical protein IJ095_02980 [Candidatus Saccharibacteria bacterium]|nr:hypothetical protein [Candidatus Saccharibacteria bacterium]